MQQRFAAGNGDAVEDAFSLLEEREEFLRIESRAKLFGQNERGVVAEGTAEVAARGKDRAGYVAGIIQQSELLEPAELHGGTSLHFRVRD